MNVLDATRITDGRRVALKAVKKTDHPYELEITQYLNRPELLADSRNRCSRILETLDVPESDVTIVVMPLLREWDEPPLRTVGEAVHFFNQIATVSSVDNICY